MGNILTYLKWRGDLTFAECPFCEVDNLVLAELSYLDLFGIVPAVEQGGGISVTEAAEEFYRAESKNKCVGGPDDEFFSVLSNSKRFKNAVLSKFTEVFDEDSQTDFAAMHINLDDETVYVAFRGTSAALVGWREDFSMSFQLMPSQKLAAEYLKATADDENLRYRVGGHSKGGNLAVYAVMMYPEDKCERIIEVYSNDGPGFCKELFDMNAYTRIRSKIIRIVPEFSVIGSLFELDPPTMIVASNADGFPQHEGMSWQVEGDKFLTCEKRSEKCEFCNSIIDKWLESVDFEHRKTFTKDLFDSLEAGGAKNLHDLAQSGFDEFEDILLSIAQSEDKTKVMIGRFIKSFFSSFGNISFEKLLREKEMIRGIALFLIGMIVMIVPKFAAQCVGSILALAAIILLGKRLLDCAFSKEKTVRQKKPRMIFQMLLMCATAGLIAQQSLLLRFSGVLLGFLFLLAAYKWAKSALEKDTKSIARISHMVFAVVSFMMGMVPIITSGLALWQYAFTAGSFLLLYGTGQILHAMYVNGKGGEAK